MSTTDYVVDILLIVVILRQVRVQEYTARRALLPLVIVAWAGEHYLKGFPAGGNDLVLVAVLAVAGGVLGAASGVTTAMWRDEAGRVLARAGLWACLTWIAGMGFRLAFALYASSDGGGATIGRFSREHSITSGQAWTTALVLMAFAEVLVRLAILQGRRMRLEAVRAGLVAVVPAARARSDAPRSADEVGRPRT
jgi:hypothetical protein